MEKEMEQNKAAEEEKRAAGIVNLGNDLEDLLDHPGFNHILSNYVEKGLDRQKFLGCRPGKLLWMQGFEAALDGLLRYIVRGVIEKEKVFTVDAGSANEARFHLVPSAGGGFVHLKFHVSADKEIMVYFFESPVLSADGTTVHAINPNRAASTAASAGMVVYHSAKCSAAAASYYGTVLHQEQVGGAAEKKAAVLGVGAYDHPIILHNTKEYLLSARADGSDTDITMSITWHEAPKEQFDVT